jgi:phosphoenolpyruvate phosphomutase
MTKVALLRAKFREKPLTHIIGAHNPLSARLAEEAGFDGIWASGFELSAASGVPDASLISMTEHLAAARAMNEAVAIPVVADVDTGYGNAINAMHTLKQYETAGMAAMVMEDKKFPKDTSLLAGGRQELLSIEEFEGKIEASAAARRDPDFMIIARTEALIAGQGQAEAKRRAERYVAAGADAVLIHSKSDTPGEIVEFVDAWESEAPIVIVPTAYPQLTEKDIIGLEKVKMVIYGNHAIRAVVTALERVFGQIREDGGIHNVHGTIVPVTRVFELQGVAEMKENEKKFLR